MGPLVFSLTKTALSSEFAGAAIKKFGLSAMTNSKMMAGAFTAVIGAGLMAKTVLSAFAEENRKAVKANRDLIAGMAEGKEAGKKLRRAQERKFSCS